MSFYVHYGMEYILCGLSKDEARVWVNRWSLVTCPDCLERDR